MYAVNRFRADGEIQKNTLYTICESKSLQFVEKQECGDEDDVNVSYTLYEGQYGAFAYEYRPPMVTKEIKKTDIFVLAVDEAEKRVASWVIDVKVSVGGEDAIERKRSITPRIVKESPVWIMAVE